MTVHATPCHDFVRHMDFCTGSAFKLIWNEDTLEKPHDYIREALIFRPSTLHNVLKEQLMRHLTSIADEFDEEDFTILIALLHAASGDYQLLLSYAQARCLYPEAAHNLLFTDD